MAEIRIARTEADGLRPLGAPGQRAHALVFDTIGARLSERHARLFAEPSPSTDGTVVDWFAPIEGAPRKLSELPEEEAETARAAVSELVEDILRLADSMEASGDASGRRLAEALRNATEVPGEDSIYLVGDQPVLVDWAHSLDTPKAPRGVIRAMLPAPPAPPAPPIAAATGPTADPASPVVARRGPWNLLWWLGWLLLALLLAWILYLLIAPCGLAGPSFLGLDRCPRAAEAAGDIDGEIARRAALEDEVARLERQLAGTGRACRPASPTAPTPEAEPARAPEPLDEVDRRLEEAGGRRGTLNVVLAWNDIADLDLHLRCPSGAIIKHSNRQACGGELDVDANVGDVTRTPVENIVFDGAPPEGTFQVTAHLFSEHARERNRRHPFTLKIVIDGREEVYEGVLTMADRLWRRSFVYEAPE